MKMQRRDAMQEGTVNILVAHRQGVSLAPKEAMGKGSLHVACSHRCLGMAEISGPILCRHGVARQ